MKILRKVYVCACVCLCTVGLSTCTHTPCLRVCVESGRSLTGSELCHYVHINKQDPGLWGGAGAGGGGGGGGQRSNWEETAKWRPLAAACLQFVWPEACAVIKPHPGRRGDQMGARGDTQLSESGCLESEGKRTSHSRPVQIIRQTIMV